MTTSRADLAHRLDVLYSAAGAPPLEAISVRATRELRARNPRGREVSAQRISDWRLGRSVPAKFDGLSAVLSVLIPAARQRHPEPALPGLYSTTVWHKLWSSAQQAIVTSVLAVVSMRQTQRAEQERADAQFAALIAAAQRDRFADPTESAQLALVADVERPGDPQARGLLLASQSSPLASTVEAHEGAIYGAASS